MDHQTDRQTGPQIEQQAERQPHQTDLPACCRTTQRGQDQRTALINRLSRMEGQLRGIRTMVERDAYCADILTQSAAVAAALAAFNRELLAEHVRHCVARDIRAGDDRAAEELIDLLRRLMK